MQKTKSIILVLITLSISCLVFQTKATAAGINSNVALPVREGGFVFRSQVRWLRATDDPTPANREVNVFAIPNVLLYGVTPDLSLFAIVPYIFRDVEFTEPSSGERIDKNDNGVGDATLLGRYTVYTKDYLSGTARFALLGGIKLPTGDDDLQPITTKSVDFPLGGVSTVTWGFGRHEVDTDLVYKINTEADGFEKGDELDYDLAYEFRLYPWALPETGVPDFLYFVAEANGNFSQKSKLNGNIVNDSGGNTVFLSPGLQFITKRVVFEASLQLPVIQDLNGEQVKSDFVLTTGFRFNL